MSACAGSSRLDAVKPLTTAFTSLKPKSKRTLGPSPHKPRPSKGASKRLDGLLRHFAQGGVLGAGVAEVEARHGAVEPRVVHVGLMEVLARVSHPTGKDPWHPLKASRRRLSTWFRAPLGGPALMRKWNLLGFVPMRHANHSSGLSHSIGLYELLDPK